MKITIFAKKRTASDGRAFYNYLSTLTNKNTGEEHVVQVKFRQECSSPDPHTCPRVIEFNKHDANLSSHSYESNNGETRTRRELWVSRWTDCGEFVDNSLDDFD